MSRSSFQAPLLVAVAGGSGSGKSCVANALHDRLAERALLISDDHYYFENGGRPGVDPSLVDFDRPESKDLGLLAGHLGALRRGETIARPHYCFATHRRLGETTRIAPRDVVIVEGIHVLAEDGLAALFDLAIYVEAPEVIRFIRRLKRDVAERGRTMEGVMDQFLDTVRPAHDAFIAPQRGRAHIVIDNAEQTLQLDLDTLVRPILGRIETLRPGLVTSPTGGGARRRAP